MDYMKILLLALVLVAFTGCVEEENNLDAEEIQLQMMGSMNNVESYKFKIELEQYTEFKNFTKEGSVEGIRTWTNLDGAINLSSVASKEISEIKDELFSDDQGLNRTTELELYVLNDTIYQKVGADWIKLQQPDLQYSLDMVDRAKLVLEMVNRSEIVAVESDKVNGKSCYKMEMSPDESTSYGFMVGRISSVSPSYPFMINMTELFDNGSEMGWTVWVEKDTNLLVKSQIRTLYTATSDMLNIPITTTNGAVICFESDETEWFYDYDQKIYISLPEEALNAPLLLPPSQGIT